MEIKLEDLTKFELNASEISVLIKLIKKINDAKNIRKPSIFAKFFSKKKKTYNED